MTPTVTRRRVFFVLLLAIAIAGVVVVLYPEEPAPTPSEQNTHLYTTLARAGIPDAVVDITDERALVRYEVPANATVRSSEWFVLARTAAAAPDSQLVVLQVYEDGRPVEQVTVETQAIKAFSDGELHLEELEVRMDVVTADES